VKALKAARGEADDFAVLAPGESASA